MKNSDGLKSTSYFENFEGQDEISLEASAVQREEVALALDSLKLVYIRPQCRGVGLHCIL